MERLIKQIVIVYTVPGDATERELVIENTDGQVVDGIVWDQALMDKLRYAEGQGCRPPQVGPGKQGWKVTKQPAGGADARQALTAEAGSDCVWLHAQECNWECYCDS